MGRESNARAEKAFFDLAGSPDLIPEGPYCYNITEITKRGDGSPLIKTRSCPYLALESSYCAFTQETDCILLSDSCKICGVNCNGPDV
jgi:hypothetical protein